VHVFFRNPANLASLERLRAAGVNFGERDPDFGAASSAPGSAIAGTRWVITGTLSRPREEIAELILERGGKVSGSVSNKTNYLLAGADAGSKLEKARTLGVKILGEAEFETLLAGGVTEAEAPTESVAPSRKAPATKSRPPGQGGVVALELPFDE
jgi:DNA ligase (NAD+)